MPSSRRRSRASFGALTARPTGKVEFSRLRSGRAAAHHPASPADLAGRSLREHGPTMEMLIGIVLVVIALIEVIGITRVAGQNTVG